jgi:hypothetical protein
LDQALWAEAQERSLLPVPYFHAVFTVPAPLHPLFRRSPAVALGLLFDAVSETLLRVAHRRLGARIAFTVVLHTWNQRLLYHPHVHCLVTGGGLSDDGARWIGCQPGFFLPYAVLRRVFRGKLLSKLAAGLDDSRLEVERPLGRYLLEEAARQRWVVYAKAPLAGPSHVVRYVSRYTRRIALSDSRIVDYDGKEVTFRWRDRAHGNQQKVMHLRGSEFARRFVSHILPARFVRIRHYGLLANRIREAMLKRCRTLLLGNDVGPFPPRPRATADRASACLRLFGKDPARCPVCAQGRMQLRYEWVPWRRERRLNIVAPRPP